MGTRLMRRVLPLVALSLVAAGIALGASSASAVTIKVSSALGAKILVNSSGLTLYHYTDESKGEIECTGACAKVWPPLLAGSGKAVAGPGLVASKLGTIKRPDGGMQVTYNGLALYRYAADHKAGQTNGQGVEGSWFAVTSAGAITKAKPAAAPAATNTPTSSGAASASASSGSSGSTSSGSSGASSGAGTPAAPNGCTAGEIVTDPGSPCYNY